MKKEDTENRIDDYKKKCKRRVNEIKKLYKDAPQMLLYYEKMEEKYGPFFTGTAAASSVPLFTNYQWQGGSASNVTVTTSSAVGQYGIKSSNQNITGDFNLYFSWNSFPFQAQYNNVNNRLKNIAFFIGEGSNFIFQ